MHPRSSFGCPFSYFCGVHLWLAKTYIPPLWNFPLQSLDLLPNPPTAIVLAWNVNPMDSKHTVDKNMHLQQWIAWKYALDNTHIHWKRWWIDLALSSRKSYHHKNSGVILAQHVLNECVLPYSVSLYHACYEFWGKLAIYMSYMSPYIVPFNRTLNVKGGPSTVCVSWLCKKDGRAYRVKYHLISV